MSTKVCWSSLLFSAPTRGDEWSHTMYPCQSSVDYYPPMGSPAIVVQVLALVKAVVICRLKPITTQPGHGICVGGGGWSFCCSRPEFQTKMHEVGSANWCKSLEICSFPLEKTMPFSVSRVANFCLASSDAKTTVQQGQVLQSMWDNHTPVLWIPLLMIKVNPIQQALPAQHVPKTEDPIWPGRSTFPISGHAVGVMFLSCSWFSSCRIRVPVKVPQRNWM